MSGDIGIVIDKVDIYQGLKDLYYLPCDRIEHIKLLNEDKFGSCYIRNTPTDYLTPLIFCYLNQRLKDDSVVEVIVDQPIKVLQRQDERNIKMNALYAGFGSFETKEQKFVEPLTDINYTSYIVTFKKEKRAMACDYEEYHIQPYKKRVVKTRSKNRIKQY